MEVVILWLFLSLAVGAWYGNKGGNALAGIACSIAFGPLIGAAFVAVSNPGPKCPSCRERIKKGAMVCPHCQREVVRHG